MAMTTQIKRLESAFATIVVAVYQPMIVQWVSGPVIYHLARRAADSARTFSADRSAAMTTPRSVGKAAARNDDELQQALELVRTVRPRARLLGDRIDFDGEGFPMFPGIDGPGEGASFAVTSGPPIRDERQLSVVEELLPDLVPQVADVVKTLLAEHGTLPASELRQQVLSTVNHAMKDAGLQMGGDYLATDGDYIEYLSPIGIANFFRQVYFAVGEGCGPIEQAFSIAPGEELELVLETVRTQTHEEIYEYGSETVSEAATESKLITDVSDKIATQLQRESSTAISAGVSANVSGGTAVWNFGINANFGLNSTLNNASTQAREIASRRLQEVTKKASERITRTFHVRIRDTLELTSTNTTRRVIKNTLATPVSYGLRRVYNKLHVKVQDLGPRLIWQLYVPRPGRRLARSRFVHFAEGVPLTTPNTPPAVPPKPAGDVDKGSTVAAVVAGIGDAVGHWFIHFNVAAPPGRKVIRVSIDSMADIEYPNEDKKTAPLSSPSVYEGGVNVMVTKSKSNSVRIDFTYAWEPSQDVIDRWKADVEAAAKKQQAADADERAKALRAQFEESRALITARSKIRARPAADLRREERYEVLSALAGTAFGPAVGSDPPDPLQIEFFHRYFDADALFFYVHPTWWEPRYYGTPERASYEITSDSEPAPVGSSLGWILQLDGDDRRNEFINSPWVRACVPIYPGREREAIAWLAEHVEGKVGYDTNADPLKKLLKDIETFRTSERGLGVDGAEYITVSSTIPGGTGGTTTPPGAAVYPVVSEFDIAVPTEGFVYDDIDIKIP
jgi:hypothetical protein